MISDMIRNIISTNLAGLHRDKHSLLCIYFRIFFCILPHRNFARFQSDSCATVIGLNLFNIVMNILSFSHGHVITCNPVLKNRHSIASYVIDWNIIVIKTEWKRKLLHGKIRQRQSKWLKKCYEIRSTKPRSWFSALHYLAPFHYQYIDSSTHLIEWKGRN